MNPSPPLQPQKVGTKNPHRFFRNDGDDKQQLINKKKSKIRCHIPGS